jgi:hypothetical protein
MGSFLIFPQFNIFEANGLFKIVDKRILVRIDSKIVLH